MYSENESACVIVGSFRAITAASRSVWFRGMARAAYLTAPIQ